MLKLQPSKNTSYQTQHQARKKKPLITYFQLVELITFPKMYMLGGGEKLAHSFLTV